MLQTAVLLGVFLVGAAVAETGLGLQHCAIAFLVLGSDADVGDD